MVGRTGSLSAEFCCSPKGKLFLKHMKILHYAIHNVCSARITKHHICIDFITCDDQIKHGKDVKDRECRKT